MKKVTLAEFTQDFIADIDAKILTLSENQIDTIIEEIHDEPDLMQELLIEVEKKRDYYFKMQNSYNYAHFKSAVTYLIIIIALAYAWYLISIKYFIPLQKELDALIKELEYLGITFIKGKTQSTGCFKQISAHHTHLMPSQYITAREIMDQICYVNAKIHGIVIKGIHSGIISGIIAYFIIMCSTIRRGIWPQYKDRYEKYCLIEQKLQDAII